MEIIPPAAAATAPPRRGGAVTEEERQRKRKTSNRLSAQRSRIKRQQREDNLSARAAQLAIDNEDMRVTAGLVQQQCSLVQQQNRVLSADARYLYRLLEQRNSQLRMLGQFTGVPMDVQEIPVHLSQLYGGVHMPLAPPLSLPQQIQMMFQPDHPDEIMDEDRRPEDVMAPPLSLPPEFQMPFQPDQDLPDDIADEDGRPDDIMDLPRKDLPWTMQVASTLPWL